MKKTELGSPISTHFLQEFRWLDLLRVILPMLIVVLSPTIYGLWRTLYGYSNYGPAAAATWGRNWFLLGGFLVIFLLIYSLNRLRKAHTWVEVYTWGLLFSFPPGRKRMLYWEDIIGITNYSVTKSFLGIQGKTKNHLIIHSRKYKPIKCHPLIKNLAGLKKTIKKQVYERLKPKFLTAFRDGKTIPFGDILISKQSIVLQKTEVPWSYIEGFSVQKGILFIKLTAQSQIEIPIRNIFNLEILVSIIKTEI
jgi:hypothetical protein